MSRSACVHGVVAGSDGRRWWSWCRSADPARPRVRSVWVLGIPILLQLLSARRGSSLLVRGSGRLRSPTPCRSRGPPVRGRPDVAVKMDSEYELEYDIDNTIKKQVRNEAARGSTAWFAGTAVCVAVGVRSVCLPSGMALGFNGGMSQNNVSNLGISYEPLLKSCTQILKKRILFWADRDFRPAFVRWFRSISKTVPVLCR